MDDADDANIVGRCIHTIKKKTDALVVDNMEMGLQVEANKTKYMDMSQDQNGGQRHNIKIDNTSFETVGKNLIKKKFYSGRNLSRLKSENTCYFSEQNHLCSRLLSKNMWGC